MRRNDFLKVAPVRGEPDPFVADTCGRAATRGDKRRQQLARSAIPKMNNCT